MDTDTPSSEQVLWSGSPARYPLFDRQDVFLVPFSILWCGFAVFWETSVVTSGGPIFFDVWGLVFVAIGLYMCIGRLITRQVMLRRVAYIITDRRIIMRWNGKREQSRYLDHLEPPVLRESDDGVGTIRFGSTSPFQFNFQQRRGLMGQDLFVLHAIPQARSVRDIILTARK